MRQLVADRREKTEIRPVMASTVEVFEALGLQDDSRN